MTGRVARRRNDHNGTVAEHIAVALEQGHRVIGIEARRAVGARPFVFGLLNIEHDLREQLDIADMVGMGMRDRHRLDVGGLDAELVELAGERFRPFHVERAIGAGRALRRRGKPVGKAGIPEEPALRVMDQVATSNLISRDSPARRLGPMHRLPCPRLNPLAPRPPTEHRATPRPKCVPADPVNKLRRDRRRAMSGTRHPRA
jgi:hypothetical protein